MARPSSRSSRQVPSAETLVRPWAMTLGEDHSEEGALTAIIGLLGAILGVLAGAIATYLTARSNMRLELEHSYDRTLRDKRLERYQELFHISKCLPRYWRAGESPTRQDLLQFSRDFHDWYFGEGAGGMFLTPAAKSVYMRVQNKLAEATHQTASESGEESPLSVTESQAIRDLASELRHQLAEDVGAANPPRLRWTRLGPTVQPPASVGG